jgi:hypothetical protein
MKAQRRKWARPQRPKKEEESQDWASRGSL